MIITNYLFVCCHIMSKKIKKKAETLYNNHSHYSHSNMNLIQQIYVFCWITNGLSEALAMVAFKKNTLK